MKNIFIIAFTAITQLLCAQENWSFGYVQGASFSKFLVSVAKDSNVTEGFRKVYQDFEKYSFGYSSELMLRHKFSREFAFTIGLKFARNGTKYIYQLTDHNGNILPINMYSLNYHYNLMLPISLQYQLFSKGKLEVNLLGGLSPVFNFKRAVLNYTHYSDFDFTYLIFKKENESTFQRFNVNATAGFSLNYQLKKYITLFSQPTVEMGLMSIHKSVPLERRLMSFNISFGVLLNQALFKKSS